MAVNETTYGGRLYAELRQQSGYDLITEIMDYKAIQQLKIADRETTLHLFRGSSYEVIQLLKTDEPEDVASQLVAKWEEARQAGATNAAATLMFMVTCT